MSVRHAEGNTHTTGESSLRMQVVLGGAAGGIGCRVARRLAERGHTVVALDRRQPELPDAVETHVLDLTDELAVGERLAGRTVDAVVTAAGWYEIGALEDCSPAELRRHLEANLLTAHTLVHATVPAVRRREGRIVLVGSTVGSVPLPYHGAYSTAKAGLHGYAGALRRELAACGVEVALVEPGPTRTGLNERAAQADRKADSAYAAVYTAFRDYSPRSVDPDTVAAQIVKAVTADSPRTRYRVGRRARWLPRLAAVLPTGVFDRIVRAGMPDGPLGRLLDR